jgi:hypothetical protein
VVLAGAAVGLDSVDPSTWSVEAERLQQSLEEVIELASGLALLGSVLLRLMTLLSDLLSERSPSSPNSPTSPSAASSDDEGRRDSGNSLTTTGQA